MSTDCAPTVTTGPFVVGEIPAPLVYQYLDDAGAPIDLTGYTAKFVYRERDGAPTTGNATVSDAPNGKVQYVWTGTEFPTPGHYRAEFWAGNGGVNKFASVLITFDVRNPVGTVPNV